jgi:hypothetical protein
MYLARDKTKGMGGGGSMTNNRDYCNQLQSGTCKGKSIPGTETCHHPLLETYFSSSLRLCSTRLSTMSSADRGPV